MEEKKVLLSVKDLYVKFRVRGRILTAIRGISLDIYENESIAIVGESGSGKSVFTKTFPGMLDSNGYIDQGKILFNDPVLADTTVRLNGAKKHLLNRLTGRLDKLSALENGAETYRKMVALEDARKEKLALNAEEEKTFVDTLAELKFQRAETFNYKQTLDPAKEKPAIREAALKLDALDKQIKELETGKEKLLKQRRKQVKADSEYQNRCREEKKALKAQYRSQIEEKITPAMQERNRILAKEMLLSTGRFSPLSRYISTGKLIKCMKKAMQVGLDLADDNVCNDVFAPVTFRVKLLDETESTLHGTCTIDIAKIRYNKDFTQIRGKRIATVFQDPMTSLNPTITIGKQISAIILKHQGCSEAEARIKALELMRKVGIPDPENRYDDYPFQYSGGMRQRIVIAIALSCQPKILICDEPTTALDVTIQAQILKLIKELQKDFGYTIVFITHDLGVVANIADRVAVMYAGQIVEVGTVEDVFYDPRHPYTWALLSSLPQLAQRNTELYSITGTPPSLYNSITGDPFAPRNPYSMKIDTLLDPPMFQISETHSAKTWLLDPRAPKVEKPEAIQNLHEKLLNAFNI